MIKSVLIRVLLPITRITTIEGEVSKILRHLDCSRSCASA
jgi:hypothetical protein